MRDGHAVTIIADLNRRLAAMARHQGFDFVDYFGALGNAGGGIDAVDAADGVHPTVAGYARMRPLAAKAIASVR